MYKPITQVETQVTQNIRAEMIRAGLTSVEVANRVGKSPALVWKNLRGFTRTPEIREIICTKVGKTEEELWGELPRENEKKRAAG